MPSCSMPGQEIGARSREPHRHVRLWHTVTGTPASLGRGPSVLTALLVVSSFLASTALQGQVPFKPADGPAKPVRDPVTVRGCLDGRWLRITEHDIAELSGVRDVRLKGPRALMQQIQDEIGTYVEVTGLIDLPPGDRIEGHKQYKVGSRTKVAIGMTGEQTNPKAVSGTPAPPTLDVQGFEPLGDRCPGK